VWTDLLLRVAAIVSAIGWIGLVWRWTWRRGGAGDDGRRCGERALRNAGRVCAALGVAAALSGALTAVYLPALPVLLAGRAQLRLRRRAGLLLAYGASLALTASAAMLGAHFLSGSQVPALAHLHYFALCVAEASMSIACTQLVPGPGSIFSLLLPVRLFRARAGGPCLRWCVFAASMGIYGALHQALVDVIGAPLYAGLMQLIGAAG
jgi:hypothetical protein